MNIKFRPLNPTSRSARKQRFSTLNCRLYIRSKGETILENLMNRHSRPYNLYRKVVIPQVIDEFKKKGIVAKDFTWSQYSGCFCGCSPGFRFTATEAQNVHVDVNNEDFAHLVEHTQTEFKLTA